MILSALVKSKTLIPSPLSSHCVKEVSDKIISGAYSNLISSEAIQVAGVKITSTLYVPVEVTVRIGLVSPGIGIEEPSLYHL